MLDTCLQHSIGKRVTAVKQAWYFMLSCNTDLGSLGGGKKHITWETPAPTFSLTTSRQSLFLHLWNAALDLYGIRSQVLWLNLGSFDEYHCTSQRCIWLITYPRRGRSLIGRDTAQQLRGRPVRWQNKSTLSLWFLSLHFVSLSLVLFCCCGFCFFLMIYLEFDLNTLYLNYLVFVTSCSFCVF